MAAKDGDIQKVVSFLNDDPNMIDIVDSRNNTALILASGSWENNTEVIRTLIENGANVHAMNNKMRTAIFEVLNFSFLSINDIQNNDQARVSVFLMFLACHRKGYFI